MVGVYNLHMPNQDFSRFAVGEPFSERQKWDADSFELRYVNDVYLLQLNLASPSKATIQNFHKGAIHLALYGEQNVTFFCFSLGGVMDWSDQAFSIRLLPEEDQAVSPPGDYFVPISVILVDADTGNVAGMRMVTMSPNFSNVLRQRLQAQKAQPFSRETYFPLVSKIYEAFPTTKHFVKAALVYEKAGTNNK